MSEPDAPPPPGQLTELPRPPPPPPPPPRPGLLPWLTGAGFLVLAAALLWVWRNPVLPPPPSTDQTEALTRQISAIEARVGRLEQQPQTQPPDLGPLTARVTALERRPAAPPQAASPTPDLEALTARVTALEQRPAPTPPQPPPDLGPITTRIAALEQRKPPDLTPLEGRIGALEKSDRTDSKRLERLALVQSASLALAAGQKLGDLAGAPPVLAKFANAAPPTEAGLRVAFPAAAREALAAAHPATQGKPLLARLWTQAQDLVTIRQGDHVVVGDPTAGILERARVALDAGDLASAAADIATLQGEAAQAMAAWLTQARALLEARAALATWAAAG